MVIAAAALLGLSQTTGTALGGFSAMLTNASNSTASGTMAITVADSTGCSSTSAGPGSAVSCTGSLFPATVPSSSSGSRSSTISRAGTVDANSATLRWLGCGPVQFADAGSTASPLLARWNTSFAVAGPMSGSAALGLDGSTGYAESTAAEDGSSAGLQTFSMGIWFRSSITGGSGNGRGSMLAFEDNPVGTTAVSSDRILSLDAQGHVVFSVKTNSRLTVSSSQTYIDSAWHLAVASVKPASNSITLAVDGRQTSANSSSFKSAASTDPGYFKIGLSATNTAIGVPGYWPGQLSDAFVIPSALSSAQLTALSSATNTASQTAFATAINAYSPSHFWSLSDDGSASYAGTVPNLTGAPCNQVAARVSVTSGAVTNCLVPATNCTTTWGTISTGSVSVPPITATNQTLGVTLSRVASGFDSTDMPGLHLLIPATLTESRGSFSCTLSWPTQAVIVQ